MAFRLALFAIWLNRHAERYEDFTQDADDVVSAQSVKSHVSDAASHVAYNTPVNT